MTATVDGDQLAPPPLGLQDDLDDFADRAPSSGASRDQMDCVLDLGDGVGRAGGQADRQEHGQVSQVVAHETDLARH